MKFEYLIGYPVLSVSSPLHREKVKWTINMEAVKLHCSGNQPKPPDLMEGGTLGSVEYMEVAASDYLIATLRFVKNKEVVYQDDFSLDDLEIEWDEGMQPEWWDVRRTDPALDLPPDPSLERVVEGPQDAP